jgi:hypothetical protein
MTLDKSLMPVADRRQRFVESHRGGFAMVGTSSEHGSAVPSAITNHGADSHDGRGGGLGETHRSFYK